MFAHPLMVELLVRRQVPEWAERIDYTTLERLSPELVTKSLQRRYPDMIWRARDRDGKADVLILLEFQARPDRFMALRTTTYACLVLEGLVERKELGRSGRLPGVVSLVLHHGTRPWNARTRLTELFRDAAPGAYRLVSPKPPKEAEPAPSDLPSMVLGLARDWTPQELRAELPLLGRAVAACGDKDFDRFMAGCVGAMLVSKGYSEEQLAEAINMKSTMTAFERGLAEMVQEGQILILRQQAASKFGPETADKLSQLLAEMSNPERINGVADAILKCDTSEDFIARVREVQ